MESILLEIRDHLKRGDELSTEDVERIIRAHNKLLPPGAKNYAKKRLLPFYLRTKETDPQRFMTWEIDALLEKRLIALLQVKPRRTASGVATITVMTKPWKCASDCIYCPNDLRMPKSYLGDEPVCQRAERNYFDPYLQVTSRLRALRQMGHVTDKVELIVLGGTWSDYPVSYQRWFMRGLFDALNDGAAAEERVPAMRAHYRALGLTSRREEVDAFVVQAQAKVTARSTSFNVAVDELYGASEAWQEAAREQTATQKELEAAQRHNEKAPHRVVGLVVETRPDTITVRNLALLRSFGCTKIQIGVQSLDPDILKANHRYIEPERIARAFELLRLFGFKIHAHTMLNLLGATPASDKEDFKRFMTEPPFQPDEIKIYPCSLVAGTDLVAHFHDGSWRPYTHDELIDVLAADTLATPPFARISRMIRDISAHDIVVGNKKANLRQMVEASIEKAGHARAINDIRYREVSTDEVDLDTLAIDDIVYRTSNTTEHFIQWVTPDNRIAGFLRLSLPDQHALELSCAQRGATRDEHATGLDEACASGALPVNAGEAMIREVHVYGKVAGLHKKGDGAQHSGLGKRLIAYAEERAVQAGYQALNVISAVGTREYYRALGFHDTALYLQKPLSTSKNKSS